MRTQRIADIDGKSRTRIVGFNISLGFLYRALAAGFSLLLVPLMIDYLGVESYGIWITLLSMMTWISVFNQGLGDGLRNKLAESLVVDDIELARVYLSTGLIALCFISLLILLILISVAPFLNLTKIFNTNSLTQSELLRIILIVGFFFVLNNILLLNKYLLLAYQKAALTTLVTLLTNFFVVVFIVSLIRFTSGSLLYLGIFYGLSMVLANLVLISYSFKKHNEVLPSLKFFRLSKIREITHLGGKFFVLSAASVIIFTTDSIIITQVLGPAEVTPYNVVYKLFSVILVGNAILFTPLWSAYTDAFQKGDYKWIKDILRKLILLLIPLIIGVILLIIFARDIINIWVGPDIIFPNTLVVLMGVYSVMLYWNNVYTYFLSGAGNIELLMYSSITAALVNIPLSIYLAKNMGMGLNGIILGSIISLCFIAIIGPVQTYYILNKSSNNS
jgi:O-antigen/teichoic acid export membrane protein